jgi:hypothetical protein
MHGARSWSIAAVRMTGPGPAGAKGCRVRDATGVLIEIANRHERMREMGGARRRALSHLDR